jgi:hypothetical protein
VWAGCVGANPNQASKRDASPPIFHPFSYPVFIPQNGIKTG